ncbi:MAG: T9SS type A sorting domain-containing protein [Dysgonamonadaceae bacterium]|nr:T9SS type A sorting domain-containing protein [Dysgonamonadaceae bacterium]
MTFRPQGNLFFDSFTFNKVNTAVNQASTDKKFRVYPSISDGIFTVEAPQPGQLKVCSISGKTAFQAKKTGLKQEINLSRLDSGVYILTLNTDKQMYISKLIKR